MVEEVGKGEALREFGGSEELEDDGGGAVITGLLSLAVAASFGLHEISRQPGNVTAGTVDDLPTLVVYWSRTAKSRR